MHELVHAYDYLVAGVELLDCQSLAYRYVRIGCSVLGMAARFTAHQSVVPGFLDGA